MTRPVKVGLIGLGGAAKMMMPSFATHSTVSLGAGSDPRLEARERFSSQFGVPAYETIDELLDDSSIDAVYIATPHQLHCAQTIAAARRGKHVIVEKPMALTLSECDQMIEAAAQNNVSLIVGHTHSFDAPISKMREIIRSGQIGPVSMINTWNFNDYLYRPRWPDELNTKLGGGIIFNQVPHQVDVVRLLGGGKVRSVRSMAWALDPARPTEGSHLTFLQFEDGSAASLVLSGHDHFDSDEFHSWIGELGEEKLPNQQGQARARLAQSGGRDVELAMKSAASYGGPSSQNWPADPARWHHQHFGLLLVSCLCGDMRQTPDGLMIYGDSGVQHIPLEPPKCLPDKRAVLDELYESCRLGKVPLHNGHWGKATLEVCDAILVSAREKREIFLSHQVAVQD